MSWKEKLVFVGKKPCIESDVQGQTLNFYPISVTFLFKIRSVATPLSKAIATLMTSAANDSHEQTHQQLDDNEKLKDIEHTRSAADPELVRFRLEEKQKAITELVESILSDESYTLIAEMIMDSLREVFPPGNRDNPPVAEFKTTIDTLSAPELLIGLYKSNKGILDPFVKLLPPDVVSGIKNKVTNSLGG